jgi:hypothetical protein
MAAYKISQTKLQYVIETANQGIEITRKSLPDIIESKTPYVVKAYFDAYNEHVANTSAKTPVSDEVLEVETPDETPEVETPDETPVPVPVVNKPTSPFKKKPEPVIPFEEKFAKFENVVEDSNGIETPFPYEVQEVTGNTIIWRIPTQDIRQIMLKGEKMTVDLNELKKKKPNSLHNGILVSTLITIAEFA